MVAPNKSLGQHWLKDREVLSRIAEEAHITKDDTVLEIGPGLGTLTSELLKRAGQVVAVEFDSDLAAKLPAQFPGTSLSVVHGDILSYDLSELPAGYKVVANVPYYITSKIIHRLMNAVNRPSITVLLVQKEVAERIVAGPGDISMLSLSAQLFAEASLGPVVPAALFTPPPKVDSQVVILKTRPVSLLGDLSQQDFFRVARAGFGERRKKLRSSLAGGLGLSKEAVDSLLAECSLSAEARAQELSIDDWKRLTVTIVSLK